MDRHNKGLKEHKDKAREESLSKAREEKKLVETSNNDAAFEPSTVYLASGVSAMNSTSCFSSSDMISSSFEEKSNTQELHQASEDERLQETVNAIANASFLINETEKESDRDNEANAEAMKTEEVSELDSPQRCSVEGSNPISNRVFSTENSAQLHTDGRPDSTITGDRTIDAGGYRNPASTPPVDDVKRIYYLGRFLASALRYGAVNLGLEMRSDGYILVNDLLNLRIKTHARLPLSSHTVDDIQEAVKRDNTQRFGLREENGELLIRANEGHSIHLSLTVKSEGLCRRILIAEEVPVCVHGTYLKYLDSIQKEGLNRMQRLHVHFAKGVFKEKGVISGMRSNCEVLIHLNVQKYLEDGMKLYCSENGVILAEGNNGVIPPDYFAKVLTKFSFDGMKDSSNCSIWEMNMQLHLI